MRARDRHRRFLFVANGDSPLNFRQNDAGSSGDRAGFTPVV